MSFNELNNVEHTIIQKLSGRNLNTVISGTNTESQQNGYDYSPWKYVPAEKLASKPNY